MNVAAGVRTKPADPLGICSLLCGGVAIVVSALLWIVQLKPSVPFAGYGYELSHGGVLWDQALWLTGTFSLVYPALALFELIDAPLRPALF